MIINNNISSLNSWRNLTQTDGNMNKSLEKLSSGFRINRAADDAAGLAISEKMRGQINGLNQASRNAQDAISLIQTAEGALNESHKILQRMRTLAVQASNDTNVSADRSKIKAEIDALNTELTRIAGTTEFNTQKLLSGGFSSKTFMIGANSGQTVTLSISNMTAGSSGLNTSGAVSGTGAAATGVSVSTATQAQNSISSIDRAIALVSDQRSKLGALQNRLEHTIANLGVASENLQAAESRVRDADMAKEMANFTKTQILSQAGTAMLAQANQKPQAVLKLLG